MRVFVLQKGCYDSEHIVGVYASLEKAKLAAVPTGETFETDMNRAAPVSEWRWTDEENESYSNGDWQDAATITAFELG